MAELLRSADLRRYLAGQVLSLFGDSALLIVLAIWAKQLTHSSAAAGLVLFAVVAPSLLTPLAGVLVDRVRRRPLLIVVNLLSAVAVLPLLLVHDAGDVWILYVVGALYGLSYAVIGAAQSALLTTILPARLLADANGALQTVREGLRLVAPLAGAGLFVAAGGAAVALLDAATFLAAAAALASMRFAEAAPQAPATSRGAELAAGARHVATTPELRRMTLACGVALLVIGFCETVAFEVVARGLHRPPAFLGVLIAVQGVGAIAGGITAGRAARRLGEGRLAGYGMAVFAAGCLLQASGTLAAVLAGVVLFGFGLPWILVGEYTLLQRRTPAHLQGRAYGAVELMTGAPQTISIALGAGLVAVVDYRILLAVIALVTAGAGASLVRGFRAGGALSERRIARSPG
ncbi:MFS transporter [Capillimicrobium parvum]|uniref:Major facilitator superfamily (MFS) profile domain-containing protein n=1 Tax=Capillimicrobium parvum TaxID=2884022 RepID=A0A9E6XTW2_9ACTN|nr:MFS transporter [Capillimicrobium parvum]UGS34105.1 hypothetical protein DSM104329_00476 [Capillimicrobium parvum]